MTDKTTYTITVRVPHKVDAEQMRKVIKHNLSMAYPAHAILITMKEEVPISRHYPASFPYVADYPDEEDA